VDRPPLEVADIFRRYGFRRYGDAYRQEAGSSLSTGHGVDCLLERKHPGSETSPLVRRAVVADPLPHQALLFRVSRVEFNDGLLRPFAASAKITMEPPERLQRNISRDAAVTLRVELERTPLCGEHAAPRSGRGMHERALGGIPEK
jgi:hypothetical protein